jgi:hypothetical protein
MNKRFVTVWATALTAFAGIATSQNLQRRASIIGGGGAPDRGKCTIEVVVDGAAEVEVRGDNGVLRNLAGQTPQWKRFECTAPVPANPPNFRFTGIDGRGGQELVRAPQGGGGAVIRINDPQGGAEGYTFDLTWGGGERILPGYGGPQQGGYPPQGRPDDHRDGGGRPYASVADSVRGCQEEVKRQVYERFHTWNVAFRRTGTEDNPGGRDVVRGIMDIRRGYDRDAVFRYTCSVNFESGTIRNVQMEPFEPESGPGSGADHAPTRLAMDNCQRAVEDNIRQRGYQHVDFLSIRVDDRPGRNDWVVGTARADIRMRSDSFAFSCNVELRDGDVRSVDVRAR